MEFLLRLWCLFVMKHKAWWQQQSSLKNKKSNPTVTTAKAEVGRPFINKALPGVEEAARLLLLSLVTQGTSLPCRKAGITVVLWVNVLITPLSCNEHMLGGSKPVWGVPVCQKDPQQCSSNIYEYIWYIIKYITMLSNFVFHVVMSWWDRG